MATEPSESFRDSMDSGPTSPQPSDRPEIAHVLFLDVVAFTTLHMEEQRESLKRLQQGGGRGPGPLPASTTRGSGRPGSTAQAARAKTALR